MIRYGLGNDFYCPILFQLYVVRQIHGTGPSISQFSAQPIFAKQNAFDKSSHLLSAIQPLVTILI